jgi:CTP synthase
VAPRARSSRSLRPRARNPLFRHLLRHADGGASKAARELAGIAKASSTEFGKTSEPVVGLMTEWVKGNGLEKRAASGDLGGTMRLGAYEAALDEATRSPISTAARPFRSATATATRSTRTIRTRLEKGGLVFSGMSPDGTLPEIVERPDHPWFIGVQFHPELKSKPFDPHPLFASFIAAAVKQSRLV